MNRRLRCVLLLLIVVFFNQCQQSPSNSVREQQISFIKEGNLSILHSEGQAIAAFSIEIATSPYERQTGLMYRSQLAKDAGMLFVFEESELRNFYMKNTLIPLDLIFIDPDFKIVHIHHNATPNNIISIASQLPAQYVLEINGGLSNQLGIKRECTLHTVKYEFRTSRKT